jgi:methylmalonyl-CoA mutase N-terminal domain/subunit
MWGTSSILILEEHRPIYAQTLCNDVRAPTWTVRQYAGFSTAESNALQTKLGCSKGLSIAFDLPHRGYDSDHERVNGEKQELR